MVDYQTIREIGYRMSKSELKTITSAKLFEILRRSTNTQSNKTLRHYAKILKEEGYIKFNSIGSWDILKK